MLEGMRKASQGAIGKLVMTIVMGLIIVSFVIWGVGDMLRGFTSDTVAKVGSTSISKEAYSHTLQSELYRLQRQLRQPLSPAQARALGLDSQVLDRMIDEAAIDARAKQMGLGVSDKTVVEAALADPALKGPDGKFDRGRFDQLLRDNGLTEQSFVAEQRNVYLRQQIEYALVDGLTPPKPLTQALQDSRAETRGIAYFTLGAAAAGDIPAPSDDALKAYFDAHKAAYRAPEYRGFDELAVTPASLAKPDQVSDADAQAQYEKDKDSKYTTPEKRKLQQIVFPNEAEAAEAAGKIKGGASFDDIAKARNLTPADLDLGDVTKAQVFDPAIAEAAFALPDGGVSGPIKGKFGYVLAHVVAITPGGVKSFDEVRGAVKQQIAIARAADQVQSLHDRIEDARGNGKPLAEAAKTVGLAVNAVPPVDREGKPVSGAAPDIADKGEVLPAVFASDIGVDDEPIATKDGGYVWFSVTKIDAAHDRTLDEVKAEVTDAWRKQEIDKRLADKAAEDVKQLNNGAEIAGLAKAASAEVKTAAEVKRAGGGGLPGNVAASVFEVPPTGAGSATTPDGRMVFKVMSDSFPAPAAGDPAVAGAEDRLKTELSSSVVEQYVEAVKREIGVSVDRRVLQGAEGG